MKLKLKTMPDIQLDIKSENDFIPIVIKRKIILYETYKEIRIRQSSGKLAEYVYAGTITYISTIPYMEQYTLKVDMEDICYLVDALRLFFAETKGLFQIRQSKDTVLIDSFLMDALHFKYSEGIYTYKSL